MHNTYNTLLNDYVTLCLESPTCVFDTDLADMIGIRYDTHVHDFIFKIKNFGFKQQNKCFGLICTVNQGFLLILYLTFIQLSKRLKRIELC